MTLIKISFSVSESFTVSVRSPVSVQRGHVATLPCWLTSSQSAEDMEVRWYQGGAQKETSILLYKAKGVDYTSQKASYTDRVSFGLKDGTSGGLKTGDISLKLQNVTLEDTGKYTCFVNSLADYDSASVIDPLPFIPETGRPPLLSAVMKDDDKVNVSCESEGWHPKPELRWSDRTEALTSADVSFSKTSDGLYTVRSWLLVPSSSEVSCAVGFLSFIFIYLLWGTNTLAAVCTITLICFNMFGRNAGIIKSQFHYFKFLS
uniref:Ig-like domain-containing protein n=1 Tax=Fundulus heteroclitus TaxID=8078 RepID=A0A3Q2P8F7_FUNHE